MIGGPWVIGLWSFKAYPTDGGVVAYLFRATVVVAAVVWSVPWWTFAVSFMLLLQLAVALEAP